MKSFEELELPLEISKALKSLNFVTPTEVQAKVLPIASEGKDLISCAETGSGKTAAYGLPIVKKILANPDETAVILAPTRELAQQISEFMRDLTQHAEGIKVVSIVGGADIRKQLRQLKKNPQIVVATPGRLTDHLKRRSLKLDKTRTLVLDEGDRMLDMGFAPQIDDILKFMPDERQTMLFTATLPPKVKDLARRYLHNPERIQVGEVSQPVKTVRQSVIQVKMKDKDDRVVDELNKREGSVIIFMRTKRRTDILAKHLAGFGFKVDLIHGGRSQGQRNKAIKSFRDGESRILCATDVAARGIDVPQVQHVINFDLPMMREDYVHRIGRTARNGAEGEAVSFVTPGEHRDWQGIAKEYRIQGVELEKVPYSLPRDHEDRRGGQKPRRSFGRGRGGERGAGSEEREERGGFKKKAFGRKPFGAKKKWGSDESAERPDRSERTERPAKKAFGEKKKRWTADERYERAERDEKSETSRKKTYGKKKFGTSRWESKGVEGAPGGRKKPGSKSGAGKKTFGRKKFGASSKKSGGRPQSRPSH